MWNLQQNLLKICGSGIQIGLIFQQNLSSLSGTSLRKSYLRSPSRQKAPHERFSIWNKVQPPWILFKWHSSSPIRTPGATRMLVLYTCATRETQFLFGFYQGCLGVIFQNPLVHQICSPWKNLVGVKSGAMLREISRFWTFFEKMFWKPRVTHVYNTSTGSPLVFATVEYEFKLKVALIQTRIASPILRVHLRGAKWVHRLFLP